MGSTQLTRDIWVRFADVYDYWVIFLHYRSALYLTRVLRILSGSHAIPILHACNFNKYYVLGPLSTSPGGQVNATFNSAFHFCQQNTESRLLIIFF